MNPEPTSLIWLDPDEIEVDSVTDLRQPGLFDEELAALSQSMKWRQAQPILVRPPIANGKYRLVDGSRRRKAAKLAGIKVEAKVQAMSALDAHRLAVESNVHRKQLTAYELALAIRDIREERGWIGKQGTRQVSDYLGVSTAQVTQHEKILALPEADQQKVHRGEISADEAFLRAKIQPAKLPEVLDRAKTRLEPRGAVGGYLGPAPPPPNDSRTLEGGATTIPQDAAQSVKSSTDALRAAARDLGAFQGREPARSRTELLDFFLDMKLGRTYPRCMERFAEYFSNEFARGLPDSGEEAKRLWRMIAAEVVE
jgi:ParB/RepB/Spo0J family partition protein